jgi:hypothetical protein
MTMTKKLILIAMAAAMLPAFAMAADVSGVWVRDAKSDARPDTMYWLTRGVTNGGGGGGAQEFVLTVKQDPAALVVTNPNLKLRSVPLDGKPHTIKTDTGIQSATVTAVNQANALQITTMQPFGGMPGNATLTVKESWTLSPDGKVLTVTTVRQLPARTETDKQIYNRRS